ncbi:hypothetical protein [Dysosmobacter sp.]
MDQYTTLFPEQCKTAGFVVRDAAWVRRLTAAAGMGCVMPSAVLMVLVTLGTIAAPEPGDLPVLAGCLAAFGVVLGLGIWLLRACSRRLVVEGETLSYVPPFGRARTFQSTDIAGVRVEARGRRLCGPDGGTLGRFGENQENSALLLQYLRERKIGLLA